MSLSFDFQVLQRYCKSKVIGFVLRNFILLVVWEVDYEVNLEVGRLVRRILKQLEQKILRMQVWDLGKVFGFYLQLSRNVGLEMWKDNVG